MEIILPIALLILLGCVLLLNFLSLPANWIMLAMIFLWAYFGTVPIAASTLVIITILVILGEVFEFLTQIWGGKKYGSSGAATFGGILGSICGAVLFAPLFFGIGAIFGALLGAYFGTYFVEKMRGLENKKAFESAKGALIGRFLGIVIKLGIGTAIITLTYQALLGGADIFALDPNSFIPQDLQMPSLDTGNAVAL